MQNPFSLSVVRLGRVYKERAKEGLHLAFTNLIITDFDELKNTEITENTGFAYPRLETFIISEVLS